MSQADAGEIGRRLDASGWMRTSPAAAPDVVVVHGCAVTGRAERDAFRLVRRLRRESPGARIVVAGCLGESVVGRGGTVPGAAAVLPLAASRRADGGEPAVEPGRTRAFLKVQDGCGRRCAFCIVPSLRGPERSLPRAAAVDAVHRLSERGVPEVVLVGVHLAGWGRERKESLVDLLEELERRPPACRVRLSSVEPMEAGEALVDLVASSRVVVPHLHLPLQSGSDAVLRRMRRGLRAERFARLVLRATRANPRMHVATDLIAGYPGETEAEFAETEALASALPLASLHVFPFSPRPGTDAAREHGERPVRRDAVTRRADALREIGKAKLAGFRQSAAGTVADVVALRGGKGLTDHYLSVSLPPGGPAPGTRRMLRLERSGDALVGRPA